MKLIIAGGRNYQPDVCDQQRLADIWWDHGIEEVVCGGAKGADQFGYQWAIENGIPVKTFLPHWNTLGKAAGPARNSDMACYADALAIFDGGNGSADMLSKPKHLAYRYLT